METETTDLPSSQQVSSGKQGIVKSTSIVSFMTLISRVLGFVRDVILALIFGAGPAFDAFVVAFKLPNFLRRLFAEGAFSQAFVPVLSEYRAQREHADVRAFVSHIAGTLGFVLMLTVIVAELFVPVIVMVFAPGFVNDPVRYQYATHMLHITFPYILLIALTAFAGATLNTFNRFALPAFTPVLLNVTLILVAWFWSPHTSTPIYTLAWGVVIGGVMQLILQFPFLKRIKVFPNKPRPNFKDPGVRRVMKLMVPALFGVSVAQIGLLMDNFFASFLRAGSISWLYYSDRLVYLPQGVIGVALATVVLPHLARHFSKRNSGAYTKTLDWALRTVCLIGIPASLGLFMLAGPILTTLLYHGEFHARDVIMTAQSLRMFALGLPAFMLVKILASAFYSRQNIKTPVIIAACSVAANLLFIFLLISPMQHAGLALSTSLASYVNAGALLFILFWRKVYRPAPGWGYLALRLLTANVLMFLFVFFFQGEITEWFQLELWGRVWHLLVLLAVSVLIYFVTIFSMGLRPNDFRPKVE